MKDAALALAPTVLLIALCGCSSQQLYNAAQGWQRNECYKIADQQERSRCLASTSTSYEQYQRESQAPATNKAAP